MEDSPSDEIQLELHPVTLAAFDAACLALRLDPEAVRAGREPPALAPGREAALLEALLDGGDVPDGYERQAAQLVGEQFFAAGFRQIEGATARAGALAERCGVTSLLGGGREPASLRRVLARSGAADYSLLYRQMPLGAALEYLMTRSIDDVVEHPAKHLH